VKIDTDRDFFMTAQEAKDYGILDSVISKRLQHNEGDTADAKDK